MGWVSPRFTSCSALLLTFSAWRFVGDLVISPFLGSKLVGEDGFENASRPYFFGVPITQNWHRSQWKLGFSMVVYKLVAALQTCWRWVTPLSPVKVWYQTRGATDPCELVPSNRGSSKLGTSSLMCLACYLATILDDFGGVCWSPISIHSQICVILVRMQSQEVPCWLNQCKVPSWESG